MSEARVDADIVPLAAVALVVAAWPGTAELVPAEESPAAEVVG